MCRFSGAFKGNAFLWEKNLKPFTEVGAIGPISRLVLGPADPESKSRVGFPIIHLLPMVGNIARENAVNTRRATPR